MKSIEWEFNNGQWAFVVDGQRIELDKQHGEAFYQRLLKMQEDWNFWAKQFIQDAKIVRDQFKGSAV